MPDEAKLEDEQKMDEVNSTAAEAPPSPTADMKQALSKEVHQADFTTVETQFMNPVIYRQQLMLARGYIEAKALPPDLDNPFKVMMLFQAGMELGMTATEALSSLAFIQGRVTVWGKAIVKRLRDHGWRVKYENETPESVTATIEKFENNQSTGESYTETYTFDEAKKSGYVMMSNGGVKVGWKEGLNRKLKLRYGVLSILIKTYVPEVMGPAAGITEVDSDAFDRNTPDAINERIDKAEEDFAKNGPTKKPTTVIETKAVKKMKENEKSIDSTEEAPQSNVKEAETPPTGEEKEPFTPKVVEGL